jgi:multiple sugar transport system ATP-binding protein
MGSVSINEVRKSYGAVEVIRGVDIKIEDGEFAIFIGPSGSGKSTLLRMVAGLEAITGGTISIDDRVVNQAAPKDRDIAMVFQNYALYPHKTVAENMGFALKMQKVGKAEAAERVGRAAEILGLTGLLQRYPTQLSGGQRQRVAMGRAIVRNPKVFLFDEPLSNLDAKLRVAMRSEIKQLQKRLGTTTIYVTHDQIEAMTMGDKVVVLRDGKVEQIGAPIDLYDFPANVFVAEFIGSPSMNFLEGTVSEKAGIFRTSSGASFPVSKVPPGCEGRPMLYGIRPEHLHVGGEGVAAIVTAVETTGAATHIAASVGSESVVAMSRERIAVREGDRIRVQPDLRSSHLFDKGSGARITEAGAR